MTILSRWLAPAFLAAGLGLGAMAPAPAHASDDLARVIVDVADVIFHGGYPYYRPDRRYGYNDRLIVVRDRYRRPTYYRYVPRTVYYRDSGYRHNPPYGVAHGYWRDGRYWDGRRWHDRDRYGRDDRYDRRRWESRNSSRGHDRGWDDRKHNYKHGKGRGRDRDDD